MKTRDFRWKESEREKSMVIVELQYFSTGNTDLIIQFIILLSIGNERI